MRRNELLHLRWDHVDPDAGYLTVACTDAFTTKSGAERRVPLSDRAVAVPAAWLSATGLIPGGSGRAAKTVTDVVVGDAGGERAVATFVVSR